jgi:hypothetical protein
MSWADVTSDRDRAEASAHVLQEQDNLQAAIQVLAQAHWSFKGQLYRSR